MKLSEFWPFFTFGMAEYTFQAVLVLVTMLLLRRAKLSYFFSFVTAVLYGLLLDGAIALVGLLPMSGFVWDLLFFAVGKLFCSAGVSMMFHTYISPEAYELFVKEISRKFGADIHKFKTGYDCVSCLLGIGMSFAFFGLWHFEGVKLGTVVCALLNGTIIGLFTRFFETYWVFEDRFPWGKYF